MKPVPESTTQNPRNQDLTLATGDLEREPRNRFGEGLELLSGTRSSSVSLLALAGGDDLD